MIAALLTPALGACCYWVGWWLRGMRESRRLEAAESVVRAATMKRDGLLGADIALKAALDQWDYAHGKEIR